MLIVAGTGSALGFELVRPIVAPLADTPALSCTATKLLLPLNSGLLVRVSEAGVGGVDGIVNVPDDDHAVNAAVVGEASP